VYALVSDTRFARAELGHFPRPWELTGLILLYFKPSSKICSINIHPHRLCQWMILLHLSIRYRTYRQKAKYVTDKALIPVLKSKVLNNKWRGLYSLSHKKKIYTMKTNTIIFSFLEWINVMNTLVNVSSGEWFIQLYGILMMTLYWPCSYCAFCED
jgi:hypothetical protein